MLEIELIDDRLAQLDANTPRYGFRDLCEDAELACIFARLGIKPAGS